MVLVTAPRRRQRIGTQHSGSVLRRGRAARPGVGARCDAGRRARLPSARFRGNVQFVALARRRASGRAYPPAGVRAMAADDVPAVTRHRCRCLRRPTPVSARKPLPSAATTCFCDRRRHWLRIGATRPDRHADWTDRCRQRRSRRDLLDAALGWVSGPVFLDLIDRRDILMHRLRQRGFTVQRPFLRMGLNRRVPFGRPGAPVRRRWP